MASTSDDGRKLSVTRIKLQLTRQYPNVPPALETLPSSITIGNSEFPLAAGTYVNCVSYVFICTYIYIFIYIYIILL